MAITGLRSLDRSIIETKEWFREMQQELLYDDEEDAYQALKAVLHVLRDRLTAEQAANVAAQMPMVLAGVFYDGWSPAGKPEKIRSAEEFISRVSENLPQDKDHEADLVIKAAFKTMEDRITEGELNKIRSNLPDDFEEFFEV